MKFQHNMSKTVYYSLIHNTWQYKFLWRTCSSSLAF